MAIFSLSRNKKIAGTTFFGVLAILLFSLSSTVTFSSVNNSSSNISGAEVIDISRDPDSERGTYRVHRNGSNSALVTTQNITKNEFNENCKKDKTKYGTNIKCSWEENKKSSTQTGSNDDDEVITFSIKNGIIGCGNPDKKDYIRYTHKDNKINIKKNDCFKKGGYIWIVCNGKPTNIKHINIFKRGDVLSCLPGSLSGATLGTYIKYLDEKTTPSRIIKNVTKSYAYLNCQAGIIFNPRQSVRCTWNDAEVFSYNPPVKEIVLCTFSGSTTRNTCSTTIDNRKYSCTGRYTCPVGIYGKKGTKVTWTSTFGSSQETTIDGRTKRIVFTPDTNLPPPIPTGTYKLFLSGSATPTTTKTNITQDDALASCMATEASIDANTTIVCTWNDTEIHSRIIVTSQVTCVFSWATTATSSCTAYNYSGYTCSWVDSCSMSISGLEGFKVTWIANNNLDYPITTVLSTENQTITFPVP
mgnify:FL=1